MPEAPFKFTFTVFTPTFNRAHTLRRVFDSLSHQTFTDFEWLIVDDGSTDGTEALVRSWAAEASYPIRYVGQEHQGKHIAHNRAVREARGELFLTLDSDDACVPEALERLKHHWDTIPKEERDSYSAVTALCMDSDGRVLGDHFPRPVWDSDSAESYFRFKLRGEKWGFQRTDVLRRHPFPEHVRGSYVPEGIVWSAIARDGYKTRYVNEPLRIYFSGGSGTVDQVTRRTATHNAPGGALAYRSLLNNDLKWLTSAPIEFLKAAIQFVRFSLHTGLGLLRQVHELEPLRAKTLWFLAWPAGIILFLKDRLGVRCLGLRVARHYWATLREQDRWLKFLASRLLRRTGMCGLLTIRCDGYKLRFFPTSLSASLWVNPNARANDVALLRRWLRPGDTVVDVGANIGQLTLVAAVAVHAAGQVYALEPQPRIFQYLEGNLALNDADHVVAVNAAVGELSGRASISDRRSDDQNLVLDVGGTPVQMVALDDLPVRAGRIALLKIDVEGYELFVLRGARELLLRTDVVYLEMCEAHFNHYGYRCSDVVELLREAGFEVFARSGPNRFEKCDQGYRASVAENCVAVRDQDRFARDTGLHL